MCGIAGVARRDGGLADRETLERMARRIVHRGPDEDGYLVRHGVGFAFRRLKVIDLHTGSQPQRNEDGSIHVVFNGEIYNYVELRRELVAKGHEFRTESDTEVLVHLYEEHGPDLVRRLNGIFAFAIWDDNRRRLVLARDHVGIKPLLYAETRAGIVFGSEMGCLLESSDVPLEVDPTAVHLFLSWGAIPAPRTIYRDVRKLEPGHVLTWTPESCDVDRYWHPLEEIEGAPATLEEGRDRLRGLLEDAVDRQMVADVPLGAFLSGGVDSTAIVGLMSRRGAGVHSFSIGFSEDPVFDETPYAREAARFHRTEHVERQLGPEDVRTVIPEVLDKLDEPFGSASILPTYVVSRETRRRMTVALSGDGADELFAGYNKYLGETYRRWLGKIPRVVRRGILAPAALLLPASRDTRWGELGRKTRRLLEGIDGGPAERHDRWMRYASATEICRLLGDSLRNPGAEIVADIQADYDRRGGTDPLNRILFTDLSLALPTDMLLKVDAASMLNSLEVRVPFLDPRIVSLAMSMPGEWKMKGTHRKRVLRGAVRDLLPPKIRRRPKAGFDVPVGEWLKSELREPFWEMVSGDGNIPLDNGLVRKWYDEHTQGRADRSKILWAIFCLRWWERRRAGGPARAESPGELESVS